VSCIQQASDCESTIAGQRRFSLIYSVVYLESLLVPQEYTRKVTPWHATAGTGGRQRYRSNPFATSALEGGVWSSALPRGRPDAHFTGSWVGQTGGRSWRARKIRPNLDSNTGPSRSSLCLLWYASRFTSRVFCVRYLDKRCRKTKITRKQAVVA